MTTESYDDDDSIVDAEWIPGWENPHLYDKRVDEIACEVLGHRVGHHSTQFAGRIYHWSYCHRCGGAQWGQAPPLNYLWNALVELDARRPGRANFILTGLTDAELGGL